MTRKEASEILKDEKFWHKKIGYRYPLAVAIDMAIKALEQEPCDDAVSRQAVIDIAKSSKSNWIDNSVLFKRVNELPPVLPKREQGEWRIKMDCEGKTRTCICSKCGEETGKYTWENPNYCSNCGAKMVEPQESEE